MNPIDALETIKKAHRENDFRDEFDCLGKAVRALAIIKEKEVMLEFFKTAHEVGNYNLMVRLSYNYNKEEYSKFQLTEDEFLLIKEAFHE